MIITNFFDVDRIPVCFLFEKEYGYVCKDGDKVYFEKTTEEFDHNVFPYWGIAEKRDIENSSKEVPFDMYFTFHSMNFRVVVSGTTTEDKLKAIVEMSEFVNEKTMFISEEYTFGLVNNILFPYAIGEPMKFYKTFLDPKYMKEMLILSYPTRDERYVEKTKRHYTCRFFVEGKELFTIAGHYPNIIYEAKKTKTVYDAYRLLRPDECMGIKLASDKSVTLLAASFDGELKIREVPCKASKLLRDDIEGFDRPPFFIIKNNNFIGMTYENGEKKKFSAEIEDELLFSFIDWVSSTKQQIFEVPKEMAETLDYIYPEYDATKLEI